MLEHMMALGVAMFYGGTGAWLLWESAIIIDENTSLSWGIVVFLIGLFISAAWYLGRWMQKCDDRISIMGKKLDNIPCQRDIVCVKKDK